MTRGARLRRSGSAGAALIALAFSACSDDPTEKSNACLEDGELSSAIHNGSATPAFLKPTEAELGAVLFVETRGDGSVTSCSGVLVDELWAITARHCILNGAKVKVLNSRGKGSNVSSVLLHDTSDVALLALDKPIPGAQPLAFGTASAESYVRSKAEVAGYGFDTQGVMGRLNFQVVTLLEISSEFVVVTGDLSGACFGDSGAPLLSRGADGRLIVLGTLSGGSATCTGIDEYVRADNVAPWLRGFIQPQTPPPPLDCAEVGATGRCYGAVATWCDAGIRAETCGGREVCGWDGDLGRFGCTRQDPCTGADALGVCNESAILTCGEGLLSETLCECGLTCAIDGASGRASCVDAAAMPVSYR